MRLYVSGSLAYDRIMNYEGRFSNHILPDKIHVLNVSFNVNGLQEKLGGTAGNIAYGLAQLGEKPTVLGTLGRDGGSYVEWMEKWGIDTSGVKLVEEEHTAGAYITTDMADCQICGFNPGAMNTPCGYDCGRMDPADSLAIVAAGCPTDMKLLPEAFREHEVPFIFDPSQSLNFMDGDDLVERMQGAHILISSDYELELITRKTGRDLKGLLEMVDIVITTLGEKGSVLHRNGNSTRIPVVAADQVLDPTGAGDSYRAGLMKGIALGLELAEACLWGSTLASFAVACYGTQEYALEPGQFEERLSRVKIGA